MNQSHSNLESSTVQCPNTRIGTVTVLDVYMAPEKLYNFTLEYVDLNTINRGVCDQPPYRKVDEIHEIGNAIGRAGRTASPFALVVTLGDAHCIDYHTLQMTIAHHVLVRYTVILPLAAHVKP